MITDLDVIVEEWAYRVHDGKPNPKNGSHIYHLKEILIENKWPSVVINELLDNIKNGVPMEKVDPKKVKVNEIIKAVAELGQIISEESVYDNKYTAGTRFILNAKGLESMKKYSKQEKQVQLFHLTLLRYR